MATTAKAVPAKSRKTSRPTALTAVARRAPEQRAHALDDPSLFINRELSLLDFQRRVLEEAQDSTNPLLDRVMFLSFVGSNVDEFFMVRVAGLKRQIEKGVTESGPDAMTPAEQLRAIRASVIRLNRASHECWLKELVPALRKSGLNIVNFAELSEEQRVVADAYFQDTIFPTLTPLAFDPGRPFPHISNLSLNLAVVNLFPIPILDGGLILMLLIEGTMRRDIKLEIKERVYQAAFVFLLLFFGAVIFSDVAKSLHGWH